MLNDSLSFSCNLSLTGRNFFAHFKFGKGFMQKRLGILILSLITLDFFKTDYQLV